MMDNSLMEGKKILHVGHTAGISMMLAKFMTRAGAVSHTLYRVEQDPFRYGEVYEKYCIPHRGRVRWFLAKLLLMARKYDIIHVHSADELVPYIKKVYPRKPLVFTYHNTVITKTWEERKPYWSKADLLTIATPQLRENAPDHIIDTPNIVDTEHFKSLFPPLPRSALAFQFSFYGETDFTVKYIKEYTEKNNLNLYLYKRDENRIPHLVFPRFLDIFEYYIDIRAWEGEIIKALSTTAMQALAMGKKAYYDGKLYTSLPEENTPEVVIKSWNRLYDELM